MSIERFKRQLGLVYQERVEDVRVLVYGTNPIVPYLVMQLAFLGTGFSQGGIFVYSEEASVEKEHVRGQFLLKEEDIGRRYEEAIVSRISEAVPSAKAYVCDKLEPHRYDIVMMCPAVGEASKIDHNRVVYGYIGSSAAYIGSKPVEVVFEENIITPSLATTAASLMAQEMLRVLELIRPTEVEEVHITVNYRLRRPGIYEDVFRREQKPIFRALIGGERFRAFPEEVKEGGRALKDEVFFRVLIDPNSLLSRLIVDSIEIIEPIPAEYRRPKEQILVAPFMNAKIEEGTLVEEKVGLPKTLEVSKKLAFVGAGGVGCWALAALAVSPISGLDLVIVDMDDRVEMHNLNRQVLYGVEHIGRPKAIVAAEAVKQINPVIKCKGYCTEVREAVIIDFIEEEKQEEAEVFEEEFEEASLPELKIVDESYDMMSDLKESDYIVTSVDNLHTRYLLSIISELTGSVFINAGAERFLGNIDVIDHSRGCLVCWYGEDIKYDMQRISCTGELPILSIVTTVSLIGALQTLILLAHLTGIKMTLHSLYYSGKTNNISYCAREKCPFHRELPSHPQHLNLANYKIW
ncbi:MAG: hypothetical protein DRJ63_06200 [Thermoprotei archaeon]|nr:MAG: hypothetical protein DRJ63_06200 [Thermoprotei archaeon]